MSSSPSAPPVSFQHTEQAVQKTESVFEGNINSNCCRVCWEGLCEKLWVGCEEKDCSFWRHACCIGVTAYRKNALINLKFYCPNIQYIISKIEYNLYLSLPEKLVWLFPLRFALILFKFVNFPYEH